MENSKIEWTDHTFNPWIGCRRVSSGCAHCYAETLNNRRGWVEWGKNGSRMRTAPSTWKKPLTWQKRAARDGTRPRVFCASLADVFEDMPALDAWRDDLCHLIDVTPDLDWLILTKRPENVRRLLPPSWANRRTLPANVWIGTSIEDQKTADERIPTLLSIPARKHFLSCEPLLGPVNLHLQERHYGRDLGLWSESVDWIIVGGESGPGARPMHPVWPRAILAQCVDAGVPFFFKQWGAWAPYRMQTGDYVDGKTIKLVASRMATYTGYAVMKRVGKKQAGRLLDGVLWNDAPAPQTGRA